MKRHSAKAAQAINIYLVKEGIYLDERQSEQIAIAMEEHNSPLFDLIEGAANRLETIRETDKTGLHLDEDISRLKEAVNATQLVFP